MSSYVSSVVDMRRDESGKRFDGKMSAIMWISSIEFASMQVLHGILGELSKVLSKHERRYYAVV